MILNRVGDVALALGIFLIFQTFGSIDYSVVFLLIPQISFFTVKFFGFNIHLLTLIGILLFIGCMGKSAQFGLHTWLGDAMEGPTPVSALIHAATMVTAGVFLLARCSIIFEYAPDVRLFIAIVGVLTAFFAASTGLLQNDLKKVIAYSTASQLGYMMFACGLSNYGSGFFHLSNHAFFKALLFLSAGSIIHSTLDEQDLRRLGGLRRILPFAYSAMVIGSFSLFGIPFLSGFYSKDAILELAAVQPTAEASLCFILGSVTAFLTAFYSMRLIYLVFLSPVNGYRMVYLHAHEAPFKIALPLVVLSLPSIIIGFISRDMFIGFGTNFWSNSLFVLPEHQFLVDAEFLSFFLKHTPLMLATLGASSSFFLYRYFPVILVLIKLSFFGRHLYTFLNRKWFIDKTYNALIALPLLYFSYSISYKTIDKGLIEITGPKTAKFLANQGRVVNNLSPALLYSSVLLFFLGFLALIFIQFLSFYKKIIFIQLTILAIIAIGGKLS